MNQPAPLIYENLVTQVAEITKASENIGYLKALKDVTSIIETTVAKSKSKLEMRALGDLVQRITELTA